MSNQTPYIGSKISLISKLDIRYEGTLYSVNTADSTIALVKVRSLGTEDREVANRVPARDDVYEHIIFKASDIKDLIVCEPPKQQTLGGLPNDPAIVSVSNRPEPAASTGSSRPNTPGRTSPGGAANRAPGYGRGAPRGGSQRGGYQARPGYQQSFNRGYNGPQPLLGRANRGGFVRNGPPNVREKLRYDSDYDFEKANEQFQESLTDMLKEKLTLETKEEGVLPVEEGVKVEKEGEGDEEPFYDKTSSFFDRISCEALEKAEGRNSRPDWRRERETNQETFGHQAVRSLSYRRGFGRGRGYQGGAPRYNNYGGYNQGYNNYNGGYGGGRGYGGRGGFRRNQNNEQSTA